LIFNIYNKKIRRREGQVYFNESMQALFIISQQSIHFLESECKVQVAKLQKPCGCWELRSQDNDHQSISININAVKYNNKTDLKYKKL
jgi:hypothetical protein